MPQSRRSLLAVLLPFLFAIPPAAGADRRYAYEAVLEQPAQRASAKAGGVSWTCAGLKCTARARGGNVSVRGCGELAHAVGRIARYSSEVKMLAPADLAACNAARASDVSGARSVARATAPELTYTGIAGARE